MNLNKKFSAKEIKPVIEHYKDLAQEIKELKQKNAKNLTAGEKRILGISQKELDNSKSRGLDRVYKISIEDTTANIQDVIKDYKNDPSVEYAELNYYYHTQMAPNDTYYNSAGSWGQTYGDMWGLQAINPETAWDQSQGSDIVVAVIDTGVDYNHEDLYRDSNSNGQLDAGEQYNVWINPIEDRNSNGIIDANDFDGVDNDNNGFIDDIRGWNFVSGNNNAMDDHGHGSHCAGIIAAVGNNNKGIIGVAPLARIMIVKSLDSNGDGAETWLANGILYAAKNGARILSNSWGGMGQSQLISDAIDEARSRDCVVVAAAGNSNINTALFMPANIQGVLAVAALDPTLQKASFSNFGSVVDFCAPGVDILSLRAAGTDMYHDGAHFVPSGNSNAKYYRSNGTSMACPFVSSIAALLREQNPDLSETAVRRAITSSAGPVETAYTYIGTGIVDAETALSVVGQISDANAIITQPNDLESFSIYQNLDIQGTAEGDSYVLDFGSGYYPTAWTTISTGTTVTNGLLGTLDLSDKQGPYHIRLTVNDGTQTAVEHTVFWAEPDLHPGWPVKLGGGIVQFGSYILGTSYTATPTDADHDGSDEIFIGSAGHTFGLKGDGTILPGWPTEQMDVLSYASSSEMPGPSVADVNIDGNIEVLWTLRDYYPYWCFNGKNLDGSNMSGFPQQAIEEFSNAFDMPFVLADLDNNGTLEAVTAHTKGNTDKYYRISAFDNEGNRLFTHDLEDPNESIISLCFGDMNNDGQKDIVGVSRASFQNGPIYLHVFDGDGNEQLGYPVVLYNQIGTDYIAGPPFLADVDNDGELEVIVGINGSQSYIRCYKHDGTSVPSFPVAVGYYDTQISQYCMGDITGDGVPEIIASALKYRAPQAGRIYAFSLNGTVLPGFPFEFQGHSLFRTPAVVDVDNDGRQDICFTTESGLVYACSGNGQLIAGFPKKMSFLSTTGVSVGDIDGDDLFELITATMSGGIYVWDLPTPATHANSDWPMRHVNSRNTTVFGDVMVDEFFNIYNMTAKTKHETIQGAINAASNGDEIIVYPGTYTGDGNRDIDFGGKAITLRSIDPNNPVIVNSTIIDCQADETNRRRGFHFHNGEGADAVISGLTIQNGCAPLREELYSGGAILCENSSSPTIEKCFFTNNDDSSENAFGVVACHDDSNIIVKDCIFESNESNVLACWSSAPQILNSSFKDNQCYICVLWCDDSNAIVKNCEFTDNSVSLGAISIFSNGPSIENCTITGNTTSSEAGGIYCGSADAVIKNCLIANNVADSIGGGIDLWYSSPIIQNCTVANNTAQSSGGGITCYYSSPQITNTIFWGNTAASCPQIDSDYSSSVISYCDIEDSFDGGNWDTSLGINGGGNIDQDPQFTAEGYHLDPNSPCIDVGNNSAVDSGDKDIDGEDRIIDGGGDSNAIVDMGADEYNPD